MARARNLKPGFFTNDHLAECSMASRLLFAGLWTLADKAGRLEDRPKRIKAELLPYDDIDCDRLLNELGAHGFIARYSVQGKQYIQVLNFTKHQNPHVKEAESTIPAPDSPGANTIQAGPLTDSPLLIPSPDSSSSPNGDSPPARKPKPKLTLETLSVDHNAEWLARKRSEGRYVQHDEHFVLEQFQQFCRSKGKKYADYLDAYRNAFEWDRCQPRPSASNGNGGSKGKPNFIDASNAYVAKLEQQALAEREGAIIENHGDDLHLAETVR